MLFTCTSSVIPFPKVDSGLRILTFYPVFSHRLQIYARARASLGEKPSQIKNKYYYKFVNDS
jgi:hypothetical protein